jgi:hypothetical protein
MNTNHPTSATAKQPISTSTVSRPERALLQPPKFGGAGPPNRASRATIAFVESDRPDEPRAGDSCGDDPQVQIQVGRRCV